MAKPLPLSVVAREARAFATQAKLLATHRRSQLSIAQAERVVVLVHGFMAAPAVLEPMAEHLRVRLGEPVLVYGYGSHRSFERILDGLVDFVSSHAPESARLALVGHSLGGLLCRAYAQEHDADGRVDRLVTIACPHRGTHLARIVPTALGRALRPESEHVARLARRNHRLRGLAPTVIVAEHDHLVPASADLGDGLLDRAEHVVPGVSHNAVLYDPHTLRLVEDALR